MGFVGVRLTSFASFARLANRVVQVVKDAFVSKPPLPPLLGRWCRVGTHAFCDPDLKADLANTDNSSCVVKEKIRAEAAQAAKAKQQKSGGQPQMPLTGGGH